MAIPTVIEEVDFQANPTSKYSDIVTVDRRVVSTWHMNSTTTLLDAKGDNDGTIIGTPTLAADPFPYDADSALAFDGSADGAYVPDSPSLASKGNQSVSMVVNTPSTPGATKDILTKRGSWLVQLSSARKLIFTCKDDTSIGTVTSNTALNITTDYFVKFVYDSVNIYIYINGILDSFTPYSAGLGLDGQPIRFAFAPSSAAGAFGTFTSAVGSGNPTANVPASTVAGDFLLAHFDVLQESATVTTVPTGWVLLASVGTVSNGRTRAYYKIATGAEPASYTWTMSGSVTYTIAISRWTGVDNAFPIANAVYAVATASGTSHATGTHLPNVDNGLVLALFAVRNATASFTESSGTERYDVAGGANSTLALSSQAQGAATSIQVTGTSSLAAPGTAIMVILTGSGKDFTPITLDEVTYWSEATDLEDAEMLYEARNSGVGTYTDVSADVQSFSTKIGRQKILNEMEAGTHTPVLVNKTRKYDPANSNSTLYPTVIPSRRGRLKLDSGGTVYAVAQGFAESWPSTWDSPNWDTIPVTFLDGFDALTIADAVGTYPPALSGAQINFLLDLALWPQADRAIDAGVYAMAALNLTGDSKVLPVIQDTAKSELGLFFIDQAGIATYHDRAHRGTAARSITSQATFEDVENGANIWYKDLRPSNDKDLLVNEWTVSPDTSVVGGVAQRVTSASSRGKHWKKAQTRQTRLLTNADAREMAISLLNYTADAVYHFEKMTVQPYSTAVWQTCLGLKISDRVTVIRTPIIASGGSSITRECYIEGIALDASRDNPWEITFQLSTVSPPNFYDRTRREGPESYWRMDENV